ncbi:hypothetical protein [Acidihalobacter prosperus]
MSANVERLRLRLAQESARIMLEEGVHDFAAAKSKAAHRLKTTGRRHMPSNLEIQTAMQDRQRLFSDETDRAALRELRERALQVMQLLNQFEPRLVGSVLNGTVGLGSRVVLHVFSESVEEVIFLLMDQKVSYRESERSLRDGHVTKTYPSLVLRFREAEIEVVVFPVDGIRQSPPSPVDGRPMRRADVAELQYLLNSDD